jgi:cysteinyl-tRNA synthetase
MDFSFEALTAAQNGLNNLIRTLGTFGEGGTVNAEWKEAFTQAINDDLSFPQALAVLHDMLKSPLSHADKRATALSFDAVLGLNLNELLKRQALLNADIPEAVSALLTERNTARDNKDWKKADDLRTQIRALGFEIDDSATGAKLTRK